MKHNDLKLTILSAYGFLAFPLAAAFIALQVIVPTHYAEITNLSLTLIGGIMLVARLWDTVTDPIIGFLSDRTPAKYGKRRIWIVLSAPLICISTYALFQPEPSAGPWYLMGWTLAIYIAGTMAIVPMNAWGAEISDDYQQRSRITGMRAAFGLIGTMAALLVPALVGGEGSESLDETLKIIAILVIATLVMASVLLFFVPDNKPTKLPDTQVRDALRLLFRPSPFRQLIVSFLCNSAANAIPATLFLFYVTYLLKAPEQAGALLFLYFICASVSVPFWVWVSKKWGKQKTWHRSILIACFFFIWTPFFGEGDILLYSVVVICTGFTTGCDLILPSSMNGDLVEWDAVENGYRRPGLLFAIWGTTTKFSYALAIGIAFPLLDLFGFSAGEANDQVALTALACLYGIPCIIFKFIALYMMRNYPITESRYQEILLKSQKLENQDSTNSSHSGERVAELEAR